MGFQKLNNLSDFAVAQALVHGWLYISLKGYCMNSTRLLQVGESLEIIQTDLTQNGCEQCSSSAESLRLMTALHLCSSSLFRPSYFGRRCSASRLSCAMLRIAKLGGLRFAFYVQFFILSSFPSDSNSQFVQLQIIRICFNSLQIIFTYLVQFICYESYIAEANIFCFKGNSCITMSTEVHCFSFQPHLLCL